jgi:hypothetical protein
MRKARKWRKPPYYKIQVYDDMMKSWKDTGNVFDTIEQAKDYIAEVLFPQNARIMVVERDRRYVLET